MTWEAVLWTALATLSPSISSLIWPRIEQRLERWAEPMAAFGPWLHGVAPAYLALVTGAILSRDAGLRGHDTVAWVGGAFVCALVLAAVGFTLRSRMTHTAWPDPLRALADEPRWTLYRAAGALWTWSHALGTAIGLGLALAEWILTHRLWRAEGVQRKEVGGTLVRIATSTLFFALTRNFWLTALSQFVLMTLLRRAPGRLAETHPSTESGSAEA